MKRISETTAAVRYRREGERPREPVMATLRYHSKTINAKTQSSAEGAEVEDFFADSVFLCAFALKKSIQPISHLNEGISS